MFFNLPEYKKPWKLRIFLLNHKGRISADLTAMAFNKDFREVFNDINEFSFTIPFKIVLDFQIKSVFNPNIKKISKKNRIKVAWIDEEEQKVMREEEFIITKKNKIYGDVNGLKIDCKGSGYELKTKRIISYEVISYNCSSLLEDCLKGTGWTIGYVNPEFDTMYRSFNITSKSRLEHLIDIAKTFNAVIDYDTINKKINFYKYEELSTFNGFILSHENYIKSIEDSSEDEEIITRLHVTGKDNIGINGVNPNGQSYIDDFSYFYDEMSDSLRDKLLVYNQKFENNSLKLSNYLTLKKNEQEKLTEKQTKLHVKETELSVILDNIIIAEQNGNVSPSLIEERKEKQNEIKSINSDISELKTNIQNIENAINEFTNSLRYENFLNEEDLSELVNFIFEDEWTNESIIDENDLLKEGRKYLNENSAPKINITTEIINFFEVPSEWHNWTRFKKGDLILIEVNELGTKVRARIQELLYGETTINVVISNVESTIKDTLTRISNKLLAGDNLNKTYNFSKVGIQKVITNFNNRNDRIPDVPSVVFGTDLKHSLNDDGTVNLNVSWIFPNHEVTGNPAHNIDGFEIKLYSSTSGDEYIFGSTVANEEVFVVPYQIRTIALNSKVANKFHTIGIRAYRQVDPDINSNRVIYSSYVNVANTPYRPVEEIAIKANLTGNINGNVEGTLNGTRYLVSNEEPIDPTPNMVWKDTSGQYPVEKVYIEDKGGFVTTAASNSSSLNGYTEKDFITVEKLNKPNGIPTLDDTGNIPSSQLSNTSFTKTGHYVGDNIKGKYIDIGFMPDSVKIYTTNINDNGLFIPSIEGGFLYGDKQGVLIGLDGSPTSIYGQIHNSGFKTGNDNNTYGNKSGIIYYWEAIKN